MHTQEVILVNEKDEETGRMDKMQAHREGILHRAFSIFIFNAKGEMLLQKRSDEKYHSAGLWTNACCSHPFPGEETISAAHRRLQEELGFNTNLKKIFDFVYTASFENGLTENEFDHVFVGEYNGTIQPDPSEVSEFLFRPVAEIETDILAHPHQFTAWFVIAFPKIRDWWRTKFRV